MTDFSLHQEKMIAEESEQQYVTSYAPDNVEDNKFQMFEVWLNGVKRVITIPVQPETAINTNAPGSIINVEPVEADKTLSATAITDFSNISEKVVAAEKQPLSTSVSNPIVIDGNISNSTDEAVLLYLDKFMPDNSSRNCKYQSHGTQFNCDKKSNEAHSILQTMTDNLTVRDVTEKRRSGRFMPSEVAASVVQGVASQSLERSDNSRKSAALSNVTRSFHSFHSNAIQPLRVDDSKLPELLPKSVGEVLNCNLRIPLPSLHLNFASQIEAKTQSLLPSSSLMVSSSSPVYIYQPVVQQLTDDGSKSGVAVSKLTGQQSRQLKTPCFELKSSSFLRKQLFTSVRPQESAKQSLIKGQKIMSRRNLKVNLSQCVAVPTERQHTPFTAVSSLPVTQNGCCNSTMSQVRKVKITTGLNGSCIISVDGLNDNNSSHASSIFPSQVLDYLNKPNGGNVINCQTINNNGALKVVPSNILQNQRELRSTTYNVLPDAMVGGGVLRLTLPNVSVNSTAIRNTTKFANCGSICLSPSSGVQNGQALNLVPSKVIPNNGILPLPNALQNGEGLQVTSTNMHLKRSMFNAGTASASGIKSFPVALLSICDLPLASVVQTAQPSKPSVPLLCPVGDRFLMNYISDNQRMPLNTVVVSKLSSPPSSFSAVINSSALQPSVGFMNLGSTNCSSLISSLQGTTVTTNNSLGEHTMHHSQLNEKLSIPNEKRLILLNKPHILLSNVAENTSCLTSAAVQISQNSVLSTALGPGNLLHLPDLVVVKNALQVSTVSICTPTRPLMSSLLGSSASSLVTPVFSNKWSGRTVTNLANCSFQQASCILDTEVLSSSHTVTVASTWHPPGTSSEASLTASHLSKLRNIMPKMATSLTYSGACVVSSQAMPTVFHNNLSCLCNPSLDQNSNAAKSINSSSDQVTKSVFEFFNSRLKAQDSFLMQMPLLQPKVAHTISVNSKTFLDASVNSQPSVTLPTYLIPKPVISATLGQSPDVISCHPKKTKRVKYSRAYDYDPSDLDSDFEPGNMSSSESWSSDDSVTIGKRNHHPRRRKLRNHRKNIKLYDRYKSSGYSLRNFHDKAINFSCYVSLEKLHLNGKTTVSISESANGLFCCKCPNRKPVSVSKVPKKSVSCKNLYKLNAAVNYMSEGE